MLVHLPSCGSCMCLLRNPTLRLCSKCHHREAGGPPRDTVTARGGHGVQCSRHLVGGGRWCSSTVPMPPRQRPVWPQTSCGGDRLRDRWGGLGLVRGRISASRTAPSPQKARDREGASRVSGLGQPSVVIRTLGPSAACLASAPALKCTSRHHLVKDDKSPRAGLNDGDGDQLSIVPGHRCPIPVLDPASSSCHGCSVTKGTEGGTFLRK